MVPSIRYFQYTNFIPIVGVGKGGAHELVHVHLQRQHPLLELPRGLLALCAGFSAVNAIGTQLRE